MQAMNGGNSAMLDGEVKNVTVIDAPRSSRPLTIVTFAPPTLSEIHPAIGRTTDPINAPRNA